MLPTTAGRLAGNLRFPGAFCFLQLPAPLRTSSSITVLISTLEELGLEVTTVAAGALEDTDVFNINFGNARAVVVEDAHILLRQPNAAQILDRLRPKVSEFRTSGGRMLLISHLSLFSFPESVGSALLGDAKEIFPGLEENSAIEQYLGGRGIGSDDLATIVRFASGSPVLADEFALIASDNSHSGNSKTRLVRAAEKQVALTAMRELGASNCSELEYYVIECGMEVARRAEMPEYFTQILRQAGLANVSRNESHLLPFVNREIWCDAANTVVQEAVVPPAGWSLIAEICSRSRGSCALHSFEWRSLNTAKTGVRG